MESKIEINFTASVQELTNIIKSNEPEDVAHAFSETIAKACHLHCEADDKARKAERELASIKDVLVNYALAQLGKEDLR